MATRKSAVKKATKKAAAKKTAARAPAKKAAVKKATAKKAAAKKTAAKRAPARGASAKGTVDQYVAKLRGGPLTEVVAELRSLIREAAPEATESMKWGQPVYEAFGPFAHIKAFKNHVLFGFWRGAELLDPTGLLKGGGGRMRHVTLKSVADIDRPILQGMVRTAVTMNHAKGDPTKRGSR